MMLPPKLLTFKLQLVAEGQRRHGDKWRVAANFLHLLRRVHFLGCFCYC